MRRETIDVNHDSKSPSESQKEEPHCSRWRAGPGRARRRRRARGGPRPDARSAPACRRSLGAPASLSLSEHAGEPCPLGLRDAGRGPTPRRRLSPFRPLAARASSLAARAEAWQASPCDRGGAPRDSGVAEGSAVNRRLTAHLPATLGLTRPGHHGPEDGAARWARKRSLCCCRFSPSGILGC